ncbi:MAG: 50S ribosomal protein L11 methyltransferase [Paracoccaceae bacterium]|jgi:ribosomal protein L11 methyltransferase|nr:50S ribosomal protein L11 methyltransferase [Marinovum sp.]MAK79234.1 50S ribosomal protein L11 methyltransferase [Marinovum sp.]NCV17424.1 50S ribosomal protein L11 methyltransferase [Rhodobacterales bacterium]NCX69071.1 50S ribosomal protein L11 methyltransferase [Paracoccaceae bacterium]GIR43277.1 MAG: ribosomal protein L11 methyltransferase [Paracoccaceae bacterium]|tara:strand:+ start:1936 stop:2805 length:870 start_codon:yes stop_codon:yes gene_type:complete
MTTFTALTTLPGRINASDLGDALERLTPEPIGVGVFELEDGSGLWEVGAYFSEKPDDISLALLAAVFQAEEFKISELPQIDWVSKVQRSLKPVVAGRFFVYGSHDSDKVPPDCEPLLIEASMAFGTGHHGTTKGCLLALEQLITDGFKAKNVIDVGCGTAVLAMAAARIFSANVIASDIDSVAHSVAKMNILANGLDRNIQCFEASGFAHEQIKTKNPFDLIFANILLAPLLAIATDISKYSLSGGYVVLSGILSEQAELVVNKYTGVGFSLSNQIEIGEWVTIIFRKI